MTAASGALEAVTGCLKTYVLLLAEQEGFGHVHLHVVPRMADFDAETAGVGVFRFLGPPESERLAPDELDRLADALVPQLEARL